MGLTLDQVQRSDAFRGLDGTQQAEILRVYNRTAGLDGDPTSLTAADLDSFIRNNSLQAAPQQAVAFLRNTLAAPAALELPRATAVGALAPGARGARDDIRGLAQALMDKSINRLGTDEEFVFKALQLAFAHGKIPELNYELGRLLRQQKVELSDNRADSYIRRVIDLELGGSERQLAIDFLEVGYDRQSSTDWAYRREGLQKVFDDLGDTARDHPVIVGVAGAAAVGLAIAFPPVAIAVGIGFLIYGGGKVIKNELEAQFFSSSRAERIQNLKDSGRGMATTAMAAPSLLGAPTVMAAGRAAQAEEGALAALRTFATYGGPLARAAAGAAGTTSTPSTGSAVYFSNGQEVTNIGTQGGGTFQLAIATDAPAPKVGTLLTLNGPDQTKVNVVVTAVQKMPGYAEPQMNNYVYQVSVSTTSGRPAVAGGSAPAPGRAQGPGEPHGGAPATVPGSNVIRGYAISSRGENFTQFQASGYKDGIKLVEAFKAFRESWARDFEAREPARFKALFDAWKRDHDFLEWKRATVPERIRAARDAGAAHPTDVNIQAGTVRQFWDQQLGLNYDLATFVSVRGDLSPLGPEMFAAFRAYFGLL